MDEATNPTDFTTDGKPHDPEECTCRICFSSSSTEKLMHSPCNCKGSLGMVHLACLEQWLQTQNSDKCELCNEAFPVVRTPKGFIQWLSDAKNRQARRHLLKDFLTLALLTPLVTLATTFYITEIMNFYKDKINLISITSITFLTGLLLMFYSFYLVLTMREHFRMFSRWKAANYDIRLSICCQINEDNVENTETNDLASSGENIR